MTNALVVEQNSKPILREVVGTAFSFTPLAAATGLPLAEKMLGHFTQFGGDQLLLGLVGTLAALRFGFPQGLSFHQSVKRIAAISGACLVVSGAMGEINNYSKQLTQASPACDVSRPSLGVCASNESQRYDRR